MLRHLDGAIGDAVAALPAEARNTAPFLRLCSATADFAAASVARRLEDAATVRLLRRFLAALLPPEEDGEAGAPESEHRPLQQQPCHAARRGFMFDEGDYRVTMRVSHSPLSFIPGL